MSTLHQSGDAAAPGAADRLCLAAAPSFAVMALLTAVLESGRPDVLCLATPHGTPLSGMALMYLLMSVFHSAPWLKLLGGRRSGGRGSRTELSAPDLTQREGTIAGERT